MLGAGRLLTLFSPFITTQKKIISWLIKEEIRVICGSFITLRQRSKVGTPLGDHIDRVGQVFYEAA